MTLLGHAALGRTSSMVNNILVTYVFFVAGCTEQVGDQPETTQEGQKEQDRWPIIGKKTT
jgi:hypothetical protein